MLPSSEEIKFAEALAGMRTQSEVLILDVNQITPQIPKEKNIKLFFEQCERSGIDPTLPEYRQAFNDSCLCFLHKKFLIGRFGEDRSAMLKGSSIFAEGRTIHLGIDIFSKELEPVYSPIDGAIIRTGQEPGLHGWGYYVIIEHTLEDKKVFSFFGHLSKNLPALGPIRKGQQFAKLGDFTHFENGGWSRHLHYQLLTELPEYPHTPQGYATKKNFEEHPEMYLDPHIVLGLWL